MAGNGRIVKSGVLLVALLCAGSLVPRAATAEPNHRGKERREMRTERHDRDRDRCDDRRAEHQHDQYPSRHRDHHDGRRGDRHHDRDGNRYCDRHCSHNHAHRWPTPGGYFSMRFGARPVFYCPPPPRPVRVFYDPYCRASFTSLALFAEHAFRHGHISFVWVLEGGQPSFAYRQVRGGWERCDDWWPQGGWHRHGN